MTSTDATTALHATLTEVVELARSLGRDQLADHLMTRVDALTDDRFRVVVTGDYKAGKSALCNALVGEPVCPVDVDASTRVPTSIRHGEEVGATIVTGTLDPDRPDDSDPETTRTAIALEEMRDRVTDATHVEDEVPWLCEVTVPSPWLASGIDLVDMPGAGGIESASGFITTAELATADAAVFVTDASQELTAHELERLAAVAAAVPSVVVAFTKIDFYGEWRRIRDIDIGHLARAGFEMQLVPVSAHLWSLARQLDNDIVADESGIPGLREIISRLREEQADSDGLTEPALEALEALATLRDAATADLAAVDAGGSRAAIADLEDSLRRAEALKLDIAEWRRVLHDDINELEHDLGQELNRKRDEIYSEASQRIDDTDPAESWEQIEGWVGQRRTQLVTEMFDFLGDRAAFIKQDVVSRMSEAESELAEGDLAERESAGIDLNLAALTRQQDESRGARALTSTWAVGEPILAISQLASVSIQGMVVAAVAGLLFFKKTHKRRKVRQLEARRAEAKRNLEDHLEEVAERLLPELQRVKDKLARALRDEGLRRIGEVELSIRDALQSARHAAESDEETREARKHELNETLEALGALQERVRQHAPGVRSA
jgi:signal recognition particle receptor subunit beta